MTQVKKENMTSNLAILQIKETLRFENLKATRNLVLNQNWDSENSRNVRKNCLNLLVNLNNAQTMFGRFFFRVCRAFVNYVPLRLTCFNLHAS